MSCVQFIGKICGGGGSGSISIDRASDTRKDFVRFIKAATKSKDSPEYAELYHFLLSCFSEADTDFDGRVGPNDFDVMVERAGALPRKWGFAPTSAELFATAQERNDFRQKEFKKMNTSGSGYIAFDEWLVWCYSHICEKAKLLESQKVDSTMNTGQEDFKAFVIAAAKSRQSHEYKELYHFLQDCFTKADANRTGKIGPKEFDTMIEVAAAAPRRFGFAPSSSATYKNADERIQARTKMFKDMDVDNSGFIAFDEWLTFCYDHICMKAQTLDAGLTGKAPPAGKVNGGKCPYGFA